MSLARKIGLATVLLVASQLLSRFLGFVRDAYIASHFGASGVTDAYQAAFIIPDWLAYLLAGSTLSLTFMPIYGRYLHDGDEAEGNRVFSAIATIIAPLFVLFVIVLEFLTPSIVSVYLHRLAPPNRELASHMSQILLPVQFFLYMGGLAQATLLARHSFWIISLAPLIYNLGTILGGVFLSAELGISSLAWGTLAGAVVGHGIVPWVAAVRRGLRFRPVWLPRHPQLWVWFKASLPLMIGVSLVTVDDWIAGYFAPAQDGALSCLRFARKLVLLPIALAGQAGSQATVPFFSRIYIEGKLAEMCQLIARSARLVAIFAFFGAAYLIALAPDVVDVVFHRGAFSTADSIATARYLALFAVGIPLWSVQAIFSRAFYATLDTRTPMIWGVVATLVMLPVYSLLFSQWGVEGLVVCSSIGMGLHVGGLLLLLRRRLPEWRSMPFFSALLPAALVATGLSMATWAVRRFWVAEWGAHDVIVRLLVCTILFGSVALVSIRWVARDVWEFFSARLRRKPEAATPASSR